MMSMILRKNKSQNGIAYYKTGKGEPIILIHGLGLRAESWIEQINFFKPKEKKPIMLENLRNIFYKMDLSDKETRILSSVFASLGRKR